MGRLTKHVCIFTATLIIAVVCACAPVENPSLSLLGTPRHHVETGLTLMQHGKYRDAEREFELALRVNKSNAMAHAGLGILAAYRGDFNTAFDVMEEAKDCSVTPAENNFISVSLIRLYTMSKTDDWLEKAKEEYNVVTATDPMSPAAHYYMGVAYKEGLKFDKAAQFLAYVLDLNRGFIRRANREWRLVRRIQQAAPQTMAGKEVAIKDSITREDLAVLLMKELHVDRILGSSVPDDTEAKEKVAVREPTDIADRPRRDDIAGVCRYEIRGLTCYDDGMFHPGDIVTRAALATVTVHILETVLDGVTERGLAQTYAIHPFVDIPPDVLYYRDVMMVVSRDIMAPDPDNENFFVPLGPVSGAEALLVIDRLRQELFLL